VEVLAVTPGPPHPTVPAGPHAPPPRPVRGSLAPDPAFWRGRRVLVTGHTGFKGSWLTLWLAELGAVVRGFALPPDTTPSMFTALGLQRRCDHVVGDVRDAAAVDAALRVFEPETVLHLAAQPLVRRSYRRPVETFEVNVMGTAHVLEAARNAPSVRAVVVVTTDKCYENREWAYPYREVDPLGGHDPYAASKACSEIVAAAYRLSFFRSAAGGRAALATARAGNVIGGGDWSEDRLLPDAARAFAAGADLVIRNPGATRPWQHVVEPLGGYLSLARALLERGDDVSPAFNFGPPAQDVRPVGEVAGAFAAAWGGSARWRHEPEAKAPHEARALTLDSSRARAELGWAPRLPFAEAVDVTARWYRRFAAGEPAAAMTALTLAQIDAAQAGGTS